MPREVEYVHTKANDPKWKMPYTPAVKVRSGSLVFLAGVTAAGVYHSHPHDDAEFATIPEDPSEQARLMMENLIEVLAAAGGGLTDVVSFIKFMVDTEANQDAINQVVGSYFKSHRPASTLVEVIRLAPSPRLLVEISAIAVID
ncbi:MAG TPA: RidA family protein [Rhodothermales bacterium]|nr:RidA family protein [Rhodothermales bacterium]